MNVCWITTKAGSGVKAQSRIARDALDIDLVSSQALHTGHDASYRVDDRGVYHPVRSLTEALLDIAPDLIVFHAFNVEARQALRQIHPYAVCVARLGVNLHAELLAGKHAHVADILECLNLCDHVIASGSHPESILAAWGLPDHRISVIPSMIDASRMVPPRESIPQSVGVLGRVDSMKHQYLALEAANGVKAFDRDLVPDLLLAGQENDATLGAIEASVNPLGYPGEVRYMGHVSDPFAAFWPNVGIHLQPSHTENCPQTVLEAAVAGVPTIAASALWADDMAALPQAPVEDPHTWARFVYDLLTDDTKRMQVVEAQQAMVREFDVSNVAPDYRELFGRLVDDRIGFKIVPQVVA